VYVSGHLSLAMLEVLVHIDDTEAFLAQGYVYHAVSFDERELAILDRSALPAGWNSRPETTDSQSIGDEWLDGAHSAALAVPSVMVPPDLRFEPGYMNYLLNPGHPEFAKVARVGEIRRLE
jgi:RES domain-containing protein